MLRHILRLRAASMPEEPKQQEHECKPNYGKGEQDDEFEWAGHAECENLE